VIVVAVGLLARLTLGFLPRLRVLEIVLRINIGPPGLGCVSPICPRPPRCRHSPSTDTAIACRSPMAELLEPVADAGVRSLREPSALMPLE
jgi:hypothetical protein